MNDGSDLVGVEPEQPFSLNDFECLFIIVAESIVIFAPIDQFGCRKASEAVASDILSAVQVRNGPPEAVMISLFTSALSSPCRHW